MAPLYSNGEAGWSWIVFSAILTIKFVAICDFLQQLWSQINHMAKVAIDSMSLDSIAIFVHEHGTSHFNAVNVCDEKSKFLNFNQVFPFFSCSFAQNYACL